MYSLIVVGHPVVGHIPLHNHTLKHLQRMFCYWMDKADTLHYHWQLCSSPNHKLCKRKKSDERLENYIYGHPPLSCWSFFSKNITNNKKGFSQLYIMNLTHCSFFCVIYNRQAKINNPTSTVVDMKKWKHNCSRIIMRSFKK